MEENHDTRKYPLYSALVFFSVRPPQPMQRGDAERNGAGEVAAVGGGGSSALEKVALGLVRFPN